MTVEEKPFPWREMLETAYLHRKLILAAGLSGLALAGSLLWASPTFYKASARIQLSAEGFSGPRQKAMNSQQMKSELTLLSSPEVIKRVVSDPHYTGIERSAKMDPVRWIRGLISGLGQPEGQLEEPGQIAAKAKKLAWRIEAEGISGSNLVEVSFLDTVPVRAANFVNDLIEAHKERIAELGEKTEAVPFWDAKVSESAERLRTARESLAGFVEQRGPSQISRDEDHLRSVLARLEGEAVQTETAVLEHQANVRFLESRLASSPETIQQEVVVKENEQVQVLSQKILDLEIERLDLLARYTPESTRVQQVDQQLDVLQERLRTIATQTQAEVMTGPNPARQAMDVDLVRSQSNRITSQTKLTALRAQIGLYRQKLSLAQEAAAGRERLANELKSAQEAHENYLRKAEEARLERALLTSRIVNVSVIQPAEVPSTPEPSRALAKLLLGLILGVAVAFGLGVVRDWHRPTVKSTLEVTRLTGLPVIAEVPRQ